MGKSLETVKLINLIFKFILNIYFHPVTKFIIIMIMVIMIVIKKQKTFFILKNIPLHDS